MTDLMTWCLQCHAKIAHTLARGCSDCGEGLCPACLKAHECTHGNAARTLALRYVTYPIAVPVPVEACRERERGRGDDYDDLGWL